MNHRFCFRFFFFFCSWQTEKINKAGFWCSRTQLDGASGQPGCRQVSSIKRVFQLRRFSALQPSRTLLYIAKRTPPTLHPHLDLRQAAQLTRIIIKAVHAVSNAPQLPVYFLFISCLLLQELGDLQNQMRFAEYVLYLSLPKSVYMFYVLAALVSINCETIIFL